MLKIPYSGRYTAEMCIVSKGSVYFVNLGIT